MFLYPTRSWGAEGGQRLLLGTGVQEEKLWVHTIRVCSAPCRDLPTVLVIAEIVNFLPSSWYNAVLWI